MGAHHLRGKEGRSAIAAFQVLIAAHDDLAAAKITQRDVASGTHQHILWLQIAVNHLVIVQVVQSLQRELYWFPGLVLMLPVSTYLPAGC